eukprot:Gregarina_sp_Poly_1__4265@NODE_2321_length_2298_cov_338_532048_g1486_i0_p3_GENE_NODE_2321_length_2298_cov_338_532048_g1486_i0NODE_2321_length_2298_cov_338_532048_g1486_i0_p3_ORF_typecomplete_len195_score17_67_NODE_2321_length_2298_cov_338_532048_g1486_i07701354
MAETNTLVAICVRLVPFLSLADVTKLVLVNKAVRDYFASSNYPIDFDADNFDEEFSEACSAQGDLYVLLTHIRSLRYNRWNSFRNPNMSLSDLRWLFLVNRRSLYSVSVKGHVCVTSRFPKRCLSALDQLAPAPSIPTPDATYISPPSADTSPSVLPPNSTAFPNLHFLEWTLFASDLASPCELCVLKIGHVWL